MRVRVLSNLFFMSKFNTLFCFLILIIIFQCKQKNQLAQNELEIISELSELEAIIEREEQMDRPGKYLAIPEKSREANLQNPPIVLDIISARSDVRGIRFTDLYTKVKYILIKIPLPKDSLFATYGYDNFSFDITPNNIFASDYTRGIYQYDYSGGFITTIVENDFYYTAAPDRKNFMISSDDRQNFVGSNGKLHTIGDKLYYQYHDNPNQKSSMYVYDAEPGIISQVNLNKPEEDQTDTQKGSPLFFLPNTDKGIMSSMMGFNNTFPLNQEEWASSMGVMSSSKSGSILVSTTIQGDTLTKFQNYDPVTNYSGGPYRSVDGGGTQYSLNGIQHFRQPHNDTIYTLHGIDQLVPKYVLDFGERGIQNTLEGISIRFDLKEKFVINDFIETNSYVFIVYTKNTPSPNSARKGIVFYNACIYDKGKEELFHVYVDKKPFVPEGRNWPKKPQNFINNDYDHGPAFWPEKITHNGAPFVAFKISDLTEDDQLWKGDGSMRENIRKMKSTDYLLMIAE